MPGQFGLFLGIHLGEHHALMLLGGRLENRGEARQGPHHGAQKSTMTVSLPVTTCSKLSLVNAIVDMNRALLGSPWIPQNPVP